MLIAGRPLGQIFPAKAESVGEGLLEVRGLSGSGFRECRSDGARRRDRRTDGRRRRRAARVPAHARRRRTANRRVDRGPGSPGRGRTACGDPARRHRLRFRRPPCRRIVPLAVGARECRARRARPYIAPGRRRHGAAKSRSATISSSACACGPGRSKRAVSDLSGGNQQKVLIGRELAAEPRVLLVDEPTKGVDVAARTEIYQRLRTLAQQGVAVVVSSSDGIELEGLCDRVLIFARGHIVRELTRRRSHRRDHHRSEPDRDGVAQGRCSRRPGEASAGAGCWPATISPRSSWPSLPA